MRAQLNNAWPVLKHYDQQHLSRIAMPLGGIGTGTVSLGGRGDLRDWEIVNRPAKGYKPANSFFALYVKPARGVAVTRALEGPIEPRDYEGATGCLLPNHGLPRFRRCTFHAAYPLAQVVLADPHVPLSVRMEAFNPLIPGDADASGIPIAVLRFVLMNRSERSVWASVCASLQNFIGFDGTNGYLQDNYNTFRKDAQLQGLFMQSRGDRTAEQFGTIALTTNTKGDVSYRTHWANLTWSDSLLDFWDDFSLDGKLDERRAKDDVTPTGSLAISLRVPARDSREVTFFLTWHFPNRQTWTAVQKTASTSNACCESKDWERTFERVGNYYATRYVDAWDVAVCTAATLSRLEADTVKFVRAFTASDLPDVAKEAALFNLSALRAQTCFRTEDGIFFGWEGCHDRSGCCHGSCTHVWNYEQATAFLFGDLAKKMRQVEFLHATDENGRMSFRVNLPLHRAQEYGFAAADGQMGCLMRLYRDWQLSGDDSLLHTLWPKARKALEFCWIPGGWDADRDGVMEGCQHNTMDVEYYGPNPQMQGWYLGALRAMEKMARYLHEDAFADMCRRLFAEGSRWTDTHLYNGDYYEHEVRPPGDSSHIANGLRLSYGTKNLDAPDLQLGAGCLVDQLVGQYMAHICGLGYLLDREHVRRTLRSIMKYNFRRNLHNHFNHMRSFALQEEAGLLMATYPKGGRPKRPFPYYTEVMTGFEYAGAVGMLFEGQTKDGIKCIEAIRARYDGAKRNPFDEAECGHHYARAMASWAAVLAISGFHYSAVDRCIEFAPGEGKYFWSNGYAWGTFASRARNGKKRVELIVLHGELVVRKVILTTAAEWTFPRARKIKAGQTLRVVM